MSEPVTHLVTKEWTEPMAVQAQMLAHSFSQDPERRAAIVGMLFIAWPRLIDASKPDFAGPVG